MDRSDIKVIIADDSPEFIEGLQVLFSTTEKYKIIAVLSNGEDLVNFPRLNEAHLVLTDIEMPQMGGIEAAKRINYLYPNLPMIAITMYKDSVYLEEIICAGFKGFIYKPDIADNLFETIELVLDKKFQFNRTKLKTKNKLNN